MCFLSVVCARVHTYIYIFLYVSSHIDYFRYPRKIQYIYIYIGFKYDLDLNVDYFLSNRLDPQIQAPWQAREPLNYSKRNVLQFDGILAPDDWFLSSHSFNKLNYAADSKINHKLLVSNQFYNGVKIKI